jgi:hypothetical protein
VSRGPFTIEQARDASREASRNQLHAEAFLKSSSRDQALAEEAYRKALADRIVGLHADGVAWSVCADVARGDKHVAELRRKRDIAEGVREAAVQAAWRAAADRRDVARFADWSMRRELAGLGAPDPEPEFQSVIGGRA